MKSGQLSDYFRGVGVKRLTAVDAEPTRSNQHEVGTTEAMRKQFFPEADREFPAIYIWLGEDEEVLSVYDNATYYDARRHQPHRSAEWRLYYRSNVVTEAMNEGDTLFLAMDNSERLYFIVVPAASTSERQLSWLFGLSPTGSTFVSRDTSDDATELGFAARFVLEEIGIAVAEPDAQSLDEVIRKFGTTFPKTMEFSALARETLPDVSARDDPDNALLEWLTQEESLFRRLEHRVVAERLERGFMRDGNVDVDGFVSFSLSVHNRRKARMGHSLENHLEAVFQTFTIRYDRGAVTENNHRPDFLFPGVKAYRAAPASGLSSLTMLGAKSTCKDRWRQVLAEAAKIPRKHLLTLEPGISEQQTDQMRASALQLVVPNSIQKSYTDGQRQWLLSVSELLEDLTARQLRSH